MRVNGKEIKISSNISILSFIEENNLNKDRIVVEVNKNIIMKEEFEHVTLKEDDEVEIIAFVGGG